MTDRLKNTTLDMPSWDEGIKPDDFIIAIGKKQSNSVYHVLESVPRPRKDSRMVRYHLKVYVTDLLVALKRDKSQRLVTFYWYPRTKKS